MVGAWNGAAMSEPTDEELRDIRAQAIHVASRLREHTDIRWIELPWEARSYVGPPKGQGPATPRTAFYEGRCKRCGREIIIGTKDGKLDFSGTAIREMCRKK